MIKRTSTAKTKKVAIDESMEPITTVPPKGTGTSRVIPIVIALVLVVGGVGYFVNAAMKGKSADVTQGQVREGADAEEITNTIERVRALTVTSADEFPTVATIQDISILRPQNPTLYRDAENGDKLLVWSDKVVVYSASRDRLLVVMPINIAPPTPSDTQVEAATATEEPSVTLEVRNGSPTPGVARVLNDKLKAEGFKTLAPGDANNKNYTSTVIYNATGKTIPKTLQKLVASTGATVVEVLAGERESKADLLIIVGGK